MDSINELIPSIKSKLEDINNFVSTSSEFITSALPKVSKNQFGGKKHKHHFYNKYQNNNENENNLSDNDELSDNDINDNNIKVVENKPIEVIDIDNNTNNNQNINSNDNQNKNYNKNNNFNNNQNKDYNNKPKFNPNYKSQYNPNYNKDKQNENKFDNNKQISNFQKRDDKYNKSKNNIKVSTEIPSMKSRIEGTKTLIPKILSNDNIKSELNDLPTIKPNLINNKSLDMSGPQMNELYTTKLNPIQSALYQVPTITNNTIIYNDYPYQNMYRQQMIYEDILPDELLPKNILTISDRLQTCKYIKDNILDSYVKYSHDRMYIGEVMSNMINEMNNKINEHKVNDMYSKLKSIRFNPYISNITNTNTPFNNMPQNFLIYQSCYPIKKVNNLIECADKNHKLNVRLYKYPPNDYYQTFIKNKVNVFKQSHLGKEIEYYNFILNEIIKPKICPNFIILCGIVDDIKDSDIKFNQVNNIIKGKSSEIQIKDPELTSITDMYYKRIIELYNQLYSFLNYIIEEFKRKGQEEYGNKLSEMLNESNKVIVNIKQYYQNANLEENIKIPEKARKMKTDCIYLLRKLIAPLYNYLRPSFNEWLKDYYNKDEQKDLLSSVLDNVSNIKNDNTELNDDEIKVIYNNQVIIMLTEAPFCSLLQWNTREYQLINGVKRMTYTGMHNDKEIKNVLFQLLFTFHVIEKKGIYIPKFNLENNIFIKAIKSDVSKLSSLIYSIDNITFYVPNMGFLVVIDSKYNNNKDNIGDDITGLENNFNDIQCDYNNNNNPDINRIELKKQMRNNMKQVILDLTKNYNSEIISMQSVLLTNIKNDIERKIYETYDSNNFMFRDIIMNHFKDYLNNRLGTALSTDEFKNLPTGELQPLIDYKSGEIVLYQEGNQYKFAQVVSEYNRMSPTIKVMKENNEVIEEDIGNFFKYPYSDIKQIGETFDRTINNETEIYKI